MPTPEPNSLKVKASLAFAALVAVAAIWLIASQIVRDAEAARVEAGLGTLPGFRADLGYLPDDPTLGFVEIPGGPFLMGSDPAADPGAFENEVWPGMGQRTVEIPSFLIGRFEVTRAQYRRFVEETGHPVPDSLALSGPPTHPVASISWPDAVAYARWLEAELRESPETPAPIRQRLEQGWRVSLPTEAQWEKAARGTDGRIFPWGNAPDRSLANYLSVGTEPVGGRPCAGCAHGLSDMSGNVWELTRSPYTASPVLPGEGEPDLTADALWVMRGGGYTDAEGLVRAAVRGGADPGARRPFIGFRLVISPPE